MDLSKRYKDSGDNPRNILEMIEREPDWAANRLQAGEQAIEQVDTLRDEMKAIALAVCRSSTDGESDCDWHDLAGDVDLLRREYDRLCDEARHQGAELCAMREALTAMYEMYGPPSSVDALCPFPAQHPITLARLALGKSV